MLVEFEAGYTPRLLGMARMGRELGEMFRPRVDLRTPEDLSRYFRDEVVAGAVAPYERP